VKTWTLRCGKGAARRVGRRATPKAEILEVRTVLNASVLIDAGGILTLDVGSPDYTTLTIEHVDGGYRLSSPYDGYAVDLVKNAAGLPVQGSGTNDFRVAGITGLTVNANWDATLNLVSSDVPTTFHVKYDSAWITLGGGAGTVGLRGITAPVVVVSEYDLNQLHTLTHLTLMDRGSAEPTDYTITSDAVAATGGFGGVSYHGLDDLEVVGASAPVRFGVESTHAGVTRITASGGRSVFDVDATVGPDERPPLDPTGAALIEGSEWDVRGQLVLIGSDGENTFNVERTPTPVRIIPTGLVHNVVNLTRDGSTAGITHDVVIGADPPIGWPEPPSGWVCEIVVDDSAGAVARDARYAASDHVVFLKERQLKIRDSTSALTGVAGGDAQIHTTRHLSGTVLYKAPKGLANTMTVDLDERSPLPEGASWDSADIGAFAYDGGFSGGGDPESRLFVVGAPTFSGWPTDDPFTSERHVVDATGFGTLAFAQDSGVRGAISYAGLSPFGLLDLVPVADYVLDYQGAADPGVVIRSGETTPDGAPTLSVGSQAVPQAFSGVTVANKANVTIRTNGTTDLATTIDYTADAPPAGLASLTIVTSPNDAVDAAGTPPGAAFVVEASAEPRPAPIAPPEDPTAAETPADQPTGETPPSYSSEPISAAQGPATPQPQPGRVDDPSSPAPSVNEAPPPQEQVVGAGRVLHFKAAMRSSGAARGQARANSPFRNLRAVRLAHLDALRTRRLEALRTARASRSSRGR
jgi:hypothetical protein